MYEGSKDALQRRPVVTTVTYGPDSIVKRFRRARIDPGRVDPPTGPEPPTLDIEWRFFEGASRYRIHYVDPNTGFNCGWHRDEDHPDLGPVHFQYDHPTKSKRGHESARFKKTIPTEILWTILDRLFEEVVSTFTGDY